MTNRINARQARLLSFITNNPGCTKMDVVRSEWSGRGHAASYDAVNRLIKRGLVRDLNRYGRGRTRLVVVE